MRTRFGCSLPSITFHTRTLTLDPHENPRMLSKKRTAVRKQQNHPPAKASKASGTVHRQLNENDTSQPQQETSESKVEKRGNPLRSAMSLFKLSKKRRFSLISHSSYRARKAARLRECPICAEDKGKRQFPDVEQPPKCGHVVSACKTCITHHATIEIERLGRLEKVPCLDCKEPLGKGQLESLVSRCDLKKLRAIERRKVMESNPRFHACLAPHCGGYQIHTKEDTDLVVCHACGAKSCFRHRIPWHKGYTCGQYDSSHPDAATLRTSEEMLQATAKKCPGPGCAFYVEKDGGCDLVCCTRCSHQWNWTEVSFGQGEITPLPVDSHASLML